MADTPALGAGTRKGVEVRLLSSAPLGNSSVFLKPKFDISDLVQDN